MELAINTTLGSTIHGEKQPANHNNILNTHMQLKPVSSNEVSKSASKYVFSDMSTSTFE